MQNLLEKILDRGNLSPSDRDLIQKAYTVAEMAHRGQKRVSGEDYITHPLHAAYFLSELGMDATTIASCLLHDTLEDTELKPSDIKRDFGQEILFLVEGVTKLGKIEYSPNSPNKKTDRENIASLKKMLFAMAEDIRVILIKLADRYHNMETLKYLDPASRKKIAIETLEIYAPIAARLGMGRLKGQLEDMSFPYAFPEEYAWLVKNVKEKYNDRMEYIERTKPLIKRRLTDAGIKIIDLHSRAKHHYSLYQKIKKNDMDPEKVFDLVAMRIVVPDIKSCYEALGIIHKYYRPVPWGLIKDYIAVPKPNGYQSLHTTIFCEKGRIVEIQIRTEEMHKHAENGIAAHWAYSESGKKEHFKTDLKETQWVLQLKQFLQEMNPGEGLTSLKIDFFKNRIFAFTPKGDVKDLPEGATPIDFAYSIHTDLGHSLKGAKVNGKIVPLNYKLKNGDVVDVIKGKVLKPSFDWIKMAKTNEARKKIKAWFANEDKKNKSGEEEAEKEKKKNRPVKKILVEVLKKGVPVIQGQTGLMYKIAKCCNPKIGEKIRGYVTLNHGVSIHAEDCSNLRKTTDNGDRILNADWKIQDPR